MSEERKSILMFPVKGDVAKIMFADHPDAADRSEVDDPTEGMAVVIKDEGAVAQLAASLEQVLKLVKAEIVTELLVYPHNLADLTDQVAKLLSLLAVVEELTTDEGGGEDETD